MNCQIVFLDQMEEKYKKLTKPSAESTAHLCLNFGLFTYKSDTPPTEVLKTDSSVFDNNSKHLYISMFMQEN